MTTNQARRTTKPPKKYQTYMLCTCNSNYTSHNGFKYPKKGFVYAKDWEECGNGLHGLLRGEGEARHLSTSSNAIWQVLMVDSREVVDLIGKVKVPRAWVLLSGTKDKAIAKMLELGCYLCAFGIVTAGERGKAIVGNYGTAEASDWGTAKAGTYGTATAGYGGTATAGMEGTAIAGHYGTATAGNEGTANAGIEGTATAGNYGTATAGYRGTANAGDRGTAIAGDCGTASAGNHGTIQIKYWDSMSYRMRIATGYVGENGLLPDVSYKVDENGKFYEVK